MSVFKKAYRVLSEEGFWPFIQKSGNYILKEVVPDSVYRLFLPEYIKLHIGNSHAKFHTSVASLGYDFRDDFDTEKEVISHFINDLQKDDVLYDIGANAGIYSAFSGRKLSKGKVIAFEPHPVVVPALYHNLQINCKNFEAVQLAASNRTGFGKMQVTASTGADTKAEGGINIPLRELSDVIEKEELKPPTVAKIDVEGAEGEVLEGLGEYISELELLYIELHQQKMNNYEHEIDIEKRLDEEFDRVITLGEQTRATTVTHIKATNRD